MSEMIITLFFSFSHYCIKKGHVCGTFRIVFVYLSDYTCSAIIALYWPLTWLFQRNKPVIVVGLFLFKNANCFFSKPVGLCFRIADFSCYPVPVPVFHKAIVEDLVIRLWHGDDR